MGRLSLLHFLDEQEMKKVCLDELAKHFKGEQVLETELLFPF